MLQLNASPLLFEMDAPGTILSNVVVTLAVEVQPLAPVMVTVNIPAVLTVIEGVVAPVDHKKVPLPLAVNVVAGMLQLNASPLLFDMDAPGAILSNVVVTLAVEVQPLAPVMVTVNIPAVLTVIEGVISPVDHK
jgi:predicted signal transduction protein with EAL and GGDEF domain